MTRDELVGALESAKGGSDALDREIARQLGITWSPDEDGNWGGYGLLPARCHFTRSAGAALSLLPPGHRVYLERKPTNPPQPWFCTIRAHARSGVTVVAESFEIAVVLGVLVERPA